MTTPRLPTWRGRNPGEISTTPGGKATYFAEHAWLGDGIARDVRLEITDGRFTAVTAEASAEGAERLPGVVLPGFANCHSHAFHRALRGRTHADGGTFWTWRERMYAVAGRLDPDRYLTLARATYAEMALAGFTTVGEFHYLHHGPGGCHYNEPNAMADALRQAAAEAGVRLTLLDACYLTGGLNEKGFVELDEVQQRFADADEDAWADRVGLLTESEGFRLGVAIHSVRAVPTPGIDVVREAANGRPLHLHLSEQPAENEACLTHYGRTPTQVLDEHGVLAPTSSAVHATHLTEQDIALLGSARTVSCFCPSTERDLADGVGPARALVEAGSTLSLGTDQHATVDAFDDARSLELHERLRTGRRGNFTPDELLAASTRHDSIGWPDAGRLAAGERADIVAVRLDSVRTAGSDPAQIMFSAGAPDIDTVIVDGRIVVRAGAHVLGDVGRMLSEAIEVVWR